MTDTRIPALDWSRLTGGEDRAGFGADRGPARHGGREMPARHRAANLRQRLDATYKDRITA